MKHECGCERGDDCTMVTVCSLQTAVEELEQQLEAYKERFQLVAAQSIRDCEKAEKLAAQLEKVRELLNQERYIGTIHIYELQDILEKE